MVNNKKAQNINPTYIIGGVIALALFLVVGIGAGTSDSSEELFTTTNSLDDDTQRGSDDKEAYEDSDTNFIDDKNLDNGVYDALFNSTTGEFSVTLNGTEQNVTLNDIEDVLNFNLQTNEYPVNLWINDAHESGEFEAVLLYNSITEEYRLLYKLTQTTSVAFEVTGLKEFSETDAQNVKMGLESIRSTTCADVCSQGEDRVANFDTNARFDDYYDNSELVLVKTPLDSVDRVTDFVSIIKITNTSELNVVNYLEEYFVNEDGGVDDRASVTAYSITSQNWEFEEEISNYEDGSVGSFFPDEDEAFTYAYFSIDEDIQFSTSEINNENLQPQNFPLSQGGEVGAYDPETRVIGLEKVNYFKKGLSTTNSRVDESLRIWQSDDFQEVYDENSANYNAFLTNRFDELIVVDTAVDIRVNGINQELADNDIHAILVNDGRFTNIESGDYYEVSSNILAGNSVDLTLADSGLTRFYASEIRTDSFGNVQDGFAVNITGEGELIGQNAWDFIEGVLVFLGTFDFSVYEQYFTDTATDPNIEDRSSGFDQNLAFTYSSESDKTGDEANINTLIAGNISLNDYFTFDTKDYAVFMNMQTIDNPYMCKVVSRYDAELEEYVSTSICGEQLGFSKTTDQFKLAGLQQG